jgi:pentatricopeptide repeat protein
MLWALAQHPAVQAAFDHISLDVVMCITTMIAYWILQQTKASRYSRAVAAKVSSKTIDVVDQDCVEKSDDDVDSDMLVEADATSEAKVTETEAPTLEAQETEKSFDVDWHVAMMREHAAVGNIKGTLDTFRLIKQSGESLSSVMYNLVMQAWVKRGNVWAAESWMQDAKEAGLADETSFIILIKALLLVRELDKAHGLLHDMRDVGIVPSVATFDELLAGFARDGRFNDGISVVKDMDAAGIQPTNFTFAAMAKLVNSARHINLDYRSLHHVFAKYDFNLTLHGEYPSQMPLLLSVMAQAKNSDSTACVNDVEITGSMLEIQALRRTLMKHGFWEESEHNSLAPSGQSDTLQDMAYRGRAAAMLKCVSKQGLGIPSNLELVLLEYFGSDLYFLRMSIESDLVSGDSLDAISWQHPLLGFRHCWASSRSGRCGQSTLINGEETDEACFSRHIHAVHVM